MFFRKAPLIYLAALSVFVFILPASAQVIPAAEFAPQRRPRRLFLLF